MRPEIAKIEFAVQRSRNLLLRSITKDLVIAAGSVGIGFFAGLLPPPMGAVVAGFGGVHYSARLINNISKLLEEPDQATQSRYYFLWKLKRLSRH